MSNPTRPIVSPPPGEPHPESQEHADLLAERAARRAAVDTRVADLVAAPRLAQRMLFHAVDRQRAEDGRRQALRELLFGDRSGPALGEVVLLLRAGADEDADGSPNTDIGGDVYAVEVIDRRQGAAVKLWTTVVNEATDGMHFDGDHARWVAILHAVAQIHGAGDSHATASFYAGRVLGIPESD